MTNSQQNHPNSLIKNTMVYCDATNGIQGKAASVGKLLSPRYELWLAKYGKRRDWDSSKA